MTPPSLQRRLLWFVGLPVLVLWLTAGLWLAQRTSHETAEMFDHELERTAANVLAVLSMIPDERLPAIDADDLEVHQQRAEIVVRDISGHLLLDASVLPPLPADIGAPHFHTLTHRGERWRVYQRRDADRRHWIQVAVPLHDREELLATLLRVLLVPLAGLLLLLPFATWLGLRRGLAPLLQLSGTISAQPARTPTLTRADVPVELLPLTRALDSMVTHLDQSLVRERRFTADAAHELRHPLSVLRMELDLAGAADTVAARQHHLRRARQGLERMERLVGQLLTLARVETLDHLGDATVVAVAALARDVLASAAERAAPLGVDLSLQVDSEANTRGSPGLLAIALGNLVDNAILHGKPHGEVCVTIAVRGTHLELAVDDDGPGFPEDQATRAGERFARGHGNGSGLGLSIAKAIAVLHEGDIGFTGSPAGGARVVLRLPIAADAG